MPDIKRKKKDIIRVVKGVPVMLEKKFYSPLNPQQSKPWKDQPNWVKIPVILSKISSW